jgi:hypothetical protein
MVRVRLQGAVRWDVRDFVRAAQADADSAFHVPEGASPLSDSQIWRYLQMADEEIEQSYERSRKKLIRHHVARLNFLYGKATTNGELAVALNVLKHLAEIQRLLPRPEDELRRELDELRAMLKKGV